ELEVSYRDNEVDKLSGVAGGSGEYKAGAIMGNVYYDFPTNWAFTPYVGVGIGWGRVNADGVRLVGGGSISDYDDAFAYQGIIGARYALNDSFDLFADYRYFATDDLDFRTNTGASVESEYESHAIMIGFRYKFPRPAPAPA